MCSKLNVKNYLFIVGLSNATNSLIYEMSISYNIIPEIDWAILVPN